MKRILSCFILLFLIACGDDGPGVSTPNGQWHTTTDGLWFLTPDSLYAHNLYLPDRIVTSPVEIDLILSSAIDTRTREFCSQTSYDCRKINIKFILHDGFDFPCSREISGTGLCAGVYYKSSNTAHISIYRIWAGYGEPTFLSPPHTWMTVEEREKIIGWKSPSGFTFYAGIGDILCPVIPHELGHYAFGDKYGH